MDLLSLCQENWAIITAFVGVVAGWTTLKLQNLDQERRLTTLEEDAKALNPILMEIRTKLASIEATLQSLIREKK